MMTYYMCHHKEDYFRLIFKFTQITYFTYLFYTGTNLNLNYVLNLPIGFLS